jgi:hypothetical protein
MATATLAAGTPCWDGARCLDYSSEHTARFTHPDCMYGASCYQQSPDHRNRFRHPKGHDPSTLRTTPTGVLVHHHQWSFTK